MMIVEDHDDDAIRRVYTCSLITNAVCLTRTLTLLSPTYMVERIMFKLNSCLHVTMRTVNFQNPSDAVSTA